MNKITEWIVEVGYRKFHFLEGENALAFATEAAKHVIGTESVSIVPVFKSEGEDVAV